MLQSVEINYLHLFHLWTISWMLCL